MMAMMLLCFLVLFVAAGLRRRRRRVVVGTSGLVLVTTGVFHGIFVLFGGSGGDYCLGIGRG